MSSYQHQCVLRNNFKDILPDFLTCGLCAQEFLLDNISLFIAHKVRGCDQSSHVLTSSHTHAEDTSAPLTCTSCSRVFMTACKFLHHIQEDHQMALCLQKGPIYLPEEVIKPPPAHSTVNGNEFTTTKKPDCCLHNQKSSSSTDQSEHPTDLSMTSSSFSMSKRNEDKCQINFETYNSLVSTQTANPSSAIPKKRKFVFPPTNVFDSTSDPNIISDDVNIQCDSINDNEESSSRDSNVFPCKSKVSNTRGNSNLYLSETAEHQKDALCNESFNTEKKQQEKHAKLKRLLQIKTPTQDQDGISIRSSDTLSPILVYQVPFQGPQDLESEILKAPSEKNVKKNSFFEERKISTAESQAEPLRQFKDQIFPESATEQNINNLIKASLVSKTKDYKVISPQRMSSSFAGENLKESEPNLTLPSIHFSPRLISDDTKRQLSQPFFNYATLGVLEKRNPIPETLQRKNTLSDENSSSLMTLSTISSLLQTKNPLQVGSLSSQNNLSNNLQSFQKTLSPDTSFMNSKSSHTYNDEHFLKEKSQNLSSNKQNKILQAPIGEDLVDIIIQDDTTNDKISPMTFMSPVPTRHDISNNGSPDKQWSNSQEDDVFVSSGTSPKSRSPREVMDSFVGDELVCMDMDDLSGMDIKVFKKRRYPTSRPFKCGSCDQAFNQRIHLKKHMSKHTGVKPFKCQQCDYSTVERSHLKVHYRIHTGEKPYMCIYCDYATAQNSTLKIHLKRHHQVQAMPNLSKMKDNSKFTESLYESESELPNSQSVNTSHQSNNKNLSQSSFLFDRGFTKQSLSVEDPSQTYGRRDGDVVSGSRSSSPGSETLLLVPQPKGNLLYQVQDEDVPIIRDKHAIRNENRKHHQKSRRKRNDNICSQAVKASIKKATENGKTNKEEPFPVHFQSIANQQDGEHTVELENCAHGPFVNNITISTNMTQIDSSHCLSNKSGDTVKTKDKELICLSKNTQHSTSKSTYCNESQTKTINNLECSIKENSDNKHIDSHKCFESNNSGPRHSAHVSENGTSVFTEAIEKSKEANEGLYDSATTRKEDVSQCNISVERSTHSEIEAGIKGNNELDNSGSVNFASIPEKAFVRG